MLPFLWHNHNYFYYIVKVFCKNNKDDEYHYWPIEWKTHEHAMKMILQREEDSFNENKDISL